MVKVFGIGNILLKDDGIGVRLARNIKRRVDKDTINEISKEIKNATYKVDIKNIFASFLSCRAFSFATKHERAVGIPVVVRAIHIIKKLNIM